MSVGVMGIPCPACGCSLYITIPDNMETVYCRKCRVDYCRESVILVEGVADTKEQPWDPSIRQLKEDIAGLKAKELQILEDVLLTRSSISARLSHSELMALDIMKRIDFLNREIMTRLLNDENKAKAAKLVAAQTPAEGRQVKPDPLVTMKAVEEEINQDRKQELEELISSLQELEQTGGSSEQITSEKLELIEKIASPSEKNQCFQRLTSNPTKLSFEHIPIICRINVEVPVTLKAAEGE